MTIDRFHNDNKFGDIVLFDDCHEMTIYNSILLQYALEAAFVPVPFLSVTPLLYTWEEIMRTKDYYIIYPMRWNTNGKKYRRDHFVEYLMNQNDTRKIYLVYPVFNCSEIITEQLVNTFLVSIGIPRFWMDTHSMDMLLASLNLSKHVEKILWYSTPKFLHELSVLSIWDKIVYDCSDLWYNEPWLDNIQEHVLIAESEIVKNSNCIYATSEFLGKHIETRFNKKPYVIENGVHTKIFENIVEKDILFNDIPFPRLGFIGAIIDKLDFDLLCLLASNLPDISIVLIGNVHKLSQNKLNNLMEQYPNVHYRNGLPYERIPSVMKSLNVGLLPYLKNNYNKCVSPVKFFEYLAAGLPVVAINLPTINKYRHEGTVYYADSKESFIEGCIEALGWKDGEYQLARYNLAKEQEWVHKFDFMLKVLNQSEA